VILNHYSFLMPLKINKLYSDQSLVKFDQSTTTLMSWMTHPGWSDCDDDEISGRQY
jgi:hypothetical protein